MIVLQVISLVCAVLGAFLFFASGIALWRMPDVYTRMHGPTKAASLGLAFLALATLLDDAAEGAGFWPPELLILLFVCLTMPVSAQILIRAAARRGEAADARTRGRAPRSDEDE